MLLGTKIYSLYMRDNVKSGCAIAGFHCKEKRKERIRKGNRQTNRDRKRQSLIERANGGRQCKNIEW